jgi:hypothetical protein
MDLTLWGSRAAALDTPGLHTKAARRVKEAVDWFARTTGACWARVETIAARARVSKRTAQKWLSAFARWGWICSTRRGPRTSVRSVSLGQKCASFCASTDARSIYLKESKEQTPWRRDGACAKAPAKTTSASVKPGSLPSLERTDLRDPSRMGTLLGAFLRATKPDRAPAGARDPRTLLRWFGLARRALRVGTNPGALFRSLLAGKRYDWISQDDEEGARADVAAFLHGADRRRRETDALTEAMD